MKQAIVVSAVVLVMALGAWALAAPRDTPTKTEEPTQERFTIVNVSGGPMLVDTYTGQSWQLARSAHGTESVWLPIRRLDKRSEALKWRALQRSVKRRDQAKPRM